MYGFGIVDRPAYPDSHRQDETRAQEYPRILRPERSRTGTRAEGRSEFIASRRCRIGGIVTESKTQDEERYQERLTEWEDQRTRRTANATTLHKRLGFRTNWTMAEIEAWLTLRVEG